MNQLRRTFLKLSGGAGALALEGAAGVLKPGVAAAAEWNQEGFAAKAMSDALKSLGATNMIESKDITITAPEIAENGAIVPVSVASKIPNTQSISILSEKNPFPLAASFNLSNGSDAYVSTRLKLGETSNVRAVIKADGKFYTAAKEVKVTIGGCG